MTYFYGDELLFVLDKVDMSVLAGDGSLVYKLHLNLRIYRTDVTIRS